MTDKYQWTKHALYKLKYYQLGKQRIVRVLRNPDRVEEGIVPKTIACMQRAGSQKHPYEIWTMYQMLPLNKAKISNQQVGRQTTNPKLEMLKKQLSSEKKLKIISAWRYPGISPKKNPIPEEILNEIEDLI